jgi:hypothetical protein
MKKLILLLLLANYFTSFAQYKSGFLPEFFFGRQPNARAEAMGKGYVSIDGGIGSIFFNPAGVTKIQNLEINTCYTPPNFYLTKGYYTYY